MTTQAQDLIMMERAFQLSKQARLHSPPNPWVGCVIVKGNDVVGEGYTQPPGSAHAEIMALKQAKELAKGATLYCTLEPCSHFGRTPPCVNAIIAAGISRVVVGIQDPDVQVQGKGMARLKEAHIELVTGVYEQEIAASLAPYLHHRRTGRPYCFLKAAMSLDGRLAAQDGSSQWITTPESRRNSFQLRAESQAILIGAGTALIDRPSLTVRELSLLPRLPPLRVVLDPKGIVPADGPLFDTTLAPTLIITSTACPQSVQKNWESHNAEVRTVSSTENGIGLNLDEILDLLGKRGILQLMIEGGSQVLGAFLESGHCQHLSLYIGGCVLGNLGIPLFTIPSITTMKQTRSFSLMEVKRLGNDMRLDYEPNVKDLPKKP